MEYYTIIMQSSIKIKGLGAVVVSAGSVCWLLHLTQAVDYYIWLKPLIIALDSSRAVSQRQSFTPKDGWHRNYSHLEVRLLEAKIWTVAKTYLPCSW